MSSRIVFDSACLLLLLWLPFLLFTLMAVYIPFESFRDHIPFFSYLAAAESFVWQESLQSVWKSQARFLDKLLFLGQAANGCFIAHTRELLAVLVIYYLSSKLHGNYHKRPFEITCDVIPLKLFGLFEHILSNFFFRCTTTGPMTENSPHWLKYCYTSIIGNRQASSPVGRQNRVRLDSSMSDCYGDPLDTELPELEDCSGQSDAELMAATKSSFSLPSSRVTELEYGRSAENTDLMSESYCSSISSTCEGGEGGGSTSSNGCGSGISQSAQPVHTANLSAASSRYFNCHHLQDTLDQGRESAEYFETDHAISASDRSSASASTSASSSLAHATKPTGAPPEAPEAYLSTLPAERQVSIGDGNKAKDWFVFDPVYGVIPQETRELWRQQEQQRQEVLQLRSSSQQAKTRSSGLPPVRGMGLK